jgi:hypothetical protein
VQCDDPELVALVRGFRWKALFWDERAHTRRAVRFRVLGHATLEQALKPWPGIACKAIFAPFAADADAAAHAWLATLPADATPRLLAPLPVFGYPGWLPEGERAEFYALLPALQGKTTYGRTCPAGTASGWRAVTVSRMSSTAA